MKTPSHIKICNSYILQIKILNNSNRTKILLKFIIFLPICRYSYCNILSQKIKHDI